MQLILLLQVSTTPHRRHIYGKYADIRGTKVEFQALWLGTITRQDSKYALCVENNMRFCPAQPFCSALSGKIPPSRCPSTLKCNSLKTKRKVTPYEHNACKQAHSALGCHLAQGSKADRPKQPVKQDRLCATAKVGTFDW